MDKRGFSVTMLRDIARSTVGRSQAFKKGLPEVALCTFMLFFLYTCLFAGNVMVSSQQTNLLKCAGARAHQGGQGTVAITGINRTAAYNPSQWNLVGSTAYVGGSVSDLAANDSSSVVFSSYNSGATNTTFNYFPNNTSSDVDGNGNLGTQSNFTALSYGPDGIVDTLAEGGIGGSDEQWSLPTGYQDPSSAWTSETLAYDNNAATASSSSIDAGSWSAYLALNTSAIACKKIQYYVDHSAGQINRAQIDIYNGTWMNIYDGNGPWSKWSNMSFASTSVTQMRIRFYNNDHSQSETAYIYEAQFLQDAVPQNYQLDLEAQWTGVNYTMANEWLCIYGGTMSTENLLVDVWNGSGWSNAIANMSSGWNNLSVASYLVSSTFTIRFRDATPSDPTPNSWQVDVCLLQVWTSANQYTAEVEFAGSSDLNSWTSLVWLTDSSWNTDSVNVTIQVYNYTLRSYASSGTGYLNYISSTTASIDEGKTQTETSNPASFRDSPGYWKIKIKGVKSATLFQMKVDWIQFTVVVQDRPPLAQFTKSINTVDTGVFVQFDALTSYDLDGTIVSYFWSFGDGTNATGVTVTHSYVDNGTYTVTLKVTDNDGATATATAAVTVLNRPPVASFTETAETVSTGDIIYFNASASYDPDGSITSYLWSFGDGANASGITVNHAYADNGTYVVTLTVTDNDGAFSSSSSTKTVLNRPPIAAFTKTATSVLTGVSVGFNASASYDPDGLIVSYFWSFGDGTNSTGVTVSHAYMDNGTYTVTLTVMDNDASKANSTSVVTILNRAPVTSFTASATNVHKNDIVHFNASASYDPDGMVVSYFWSFGDGSNTTGVTVDHSYANAGTYTVTLNVTDNDGARASSSAVITVVNQLPVASFTSSTATVYTGTIVSFNASGSYDPDGVIVSYFWTFGDGTNATGLTTTHSYIDNWTYTVTLKVTDNDGATATTLTTVAVLNRPPVASFTQSPTTVFTGNMTTFNASASYDPDGTIVSYFWSFGDGSSASGLSVTHAYVENGVYNVALTVTDNDGLTNTAQDTIFVEDRPPAAHFTESARTVDTGPFVQFNASNSFDPDGTIVNYCWDFGDGQTGTGKVTSHAFGDNGTYTVALTVTDNDGLTNTAQDTVVVQDRPPLAQFTKSINTVDTGVFVQFDASTSYDPDGTIVSYYWNFADGKNTTGKVASHSYADNGTYTVVLMVTDNDGLTGVYLDTVLVRNKSPIASFTVSSITVYLDEIITFNATFSHDSDGRIVSYLWNFGDETNATGITVSHTYTHYGTYTVTLTATDDDGAADSSVATENVLNPATNDQAPIAALTVSAQTVYTGEAVVFNASGSYDPDGTITSYLWKFGDDFTTSGQTVTHAYADNGFYTVALTVTDDDGTMNATMAIETVLNQAPIANFTVSSATAYTDEVVVFNGLTSRDSDGKIILYFWDFDDGTNATGVVATHAYNHNGTYTIKLTVTDDDGAMDFHVATESILNHVGPNQAPIAALTVSAQTVYTGEAVVFNASGSYDPDGTITRYMWDFGDDFTTSGNIIDHAYGENGNFLVKLTVTDNGGSTMSTNTTVVVLDRSPYASFTWSTSIADREETIYFNASMSRDPDGTITIYFWDFGDQTNATGVAVCHKYVQNGNYTVTLTVTDNDDSSNATSIDETIINSSTIVSFTILPTQPSLGNLITFNASSSYDLSGTIERYMWNFGDGNTTETSTSIITHSYTVPGDFNVTLTIFNTRGHNASTSQRISLQIHNVAIIDVTLSSTETEIGQTVNITVKAKNKGTAPESFSITLLRNETVIASELVSDLPPETERVLVFYWNTSNVQNSCKFLIQAKAENVTGETALSDNSCIGGIVSLFQAQNKETSTFGFDWKWALLIAAAAVLLSAGFMWRRRNVAKKFRSFEYFDEITNGGIPESFSVLIIGGPGSGKSILCQELAHSFLTKKKSCLYVTYDCFPDEVRDNLRKFHDEISTYEAEKKLLFMDCFSATSKNKDREYYLGQSFSLADLGIVLSEAANDMGQSPKIVLDSITPLITHVEPLKVIEFLQDRGARIKGVSGTFIFTIGKATIEPNLANRLEETVDCIIELDESTNKGKTVRRLRVKKMRGKKTSDKWVRFEIEPKKGIIFPT